MNNTMPKSIDVERKGLEVPKKKSIQIGIPITEIESRQSFWENHVWMVKLHIKKGDESHFLHETTTDCLVDELLSEIVTIYNGRLKVHRICDEIDQLAKHGVSLPGNMQGLTDDQIVDLKLVDEWGNKCIPSGGFVEVKDPIGRRNGKAPTEHLVEVLTKTMKEAREMVHKSLVQRDVCLTREMVQEALNILSGACTIVYPMGLPPHEPIKMELNNEEDLTGTQAGQEVLDKATTSLWFSGKELIASADRRLADFVGRNEKTKAVLKVSRRGQGAPGREPVVNEEEQKQMMAYYYRKQEEWKKLQADGEATDGDACLDNSWADTGKLKKDFQGLGDIKWGPR